MMKNIASVLLIISTFMQSCADKIEKLPNNIQYIHEGPDYKYVLKSDAPFGTFLESNVEDIQVNSKYLLFTQKIDLEMLRETIASDFDPSARTFSPEIFAKADSIIQINKYLSDQVKYKKAYWILEKQTDSLLGPFENADFVTKKFNFEIY